MVPKARVELYAKFVNTFGVNCRLAEPQKKGESRRGDAKLGSS